jgi:hypothetical protein
MLLLLSHRLHHLVLGQLVLALLQLLLLLSLELLLLILNGYLWILEKLQHIVIGHRVTWLSLMQRMLSSYVFLGRGLSDGFCFLGNHNTFGCDARLAAVGRVMQGLLRDIGVPLHVVNGPVCPTSAHVALHKLGVRGGMIVGI